MSLNTQLVRSLKAPARPVWEEPPSKAGITAKSGYHALCCLGVLGTQWIVIVTSLSPKPMIDRDGGLVVISHPHPAPGGWEEDAATYRPGPSGTHAGEGRWGSRGSRRP